MMGILYLVATPIGNLEDITYRAVRILEEADLVAAEDTRHTKKLLNHLGINKPLISYHEHNKMEKGQVLIEKLLSGDAVALVTDAGTPGISDPGEDLVKLCHDHNIPVTSIPGPVALITGLIVSGLSTRRFVFEGFLPHDKKERKMVLEQLKDEHRTIILYEAPHRLKQTLLSIKDTLGNRQVSMTRELTKKFEEVLSMTLDEAIMKYNQEDPRGEYVLIVAGKSLESIRDDRIKQWESITIEEHMNQYMEENMSKKEAMKQVAKDRGTTKRAIYQYLIEQSE